MIAEQKMENIASYHLNALDKVRYGSNGGKFIALLLFGLCFMSAVSVYFISNSSKLEIKTLHYVERYDGLKKELDNYAIEKIEMMEEINDKTQNLARNEERMKDLRANAKLMQAKIEDFETQLVAESQSKENLHKEIDTLRKSIDEYLATQVEAEKLFARLTQQEIEANTTIQMLLREIQSCKTSISTLTDGTNEGNYKELADNKKRHEGIDTVDAPNETRDADRVEVVQSPVTSKQQAADLTEEDEKMLNADTAVEESKPVYNGETQVLSNVENDFPVTQAVPVEEVGEENVVNPHLVEPIIDPIAVDDEIQKLEPLTEEENKLNSIPLDGAREVVDLTGEDARLFIKDDNDQSDADESNVIKDYDVVDGDEEEGPGVY